MRVRLARVVTDVDFRFGVRHHVETLRAARKLPTDLRRDDCVLFVSCTRLRLAFVFPEVVMGSTRKNEERTALSHLRVDLSHAAPWSPIMLSHYAEEAGIEIVGIKRFEEHMVRLVRTVSKELRKP